MAATGNDYIYLDHAATTPLDPEVLLAMEPYFSSAFFNSSSSYGPAKINKQALEAARAACAAVLGVRPGEIIFTSGGSESDNLALKGALDGWETFGKARPHVITTPVEHHAILHPVQQLAGQGYPVTFLPVDTAGRVDPAWLEKAIRPDTGLISIIAANNEIGTIQPLAELGEIARRHKIPFHTDAVQAAGMLPLALDELKVDLLSLSAHKFYGPKGVGLLYVRRGIPFAPQILGGSQERDRRAGTENLPGIIGLTAALKLAYRDLARTGPRLACLRDRLIKGVLESVPGAVLTGAVGAERLPNHASFCFRGVFGETILLALEQAGILCSSGSACAAGSDEPSHVLLALGLDEDLARTAVRFTLGRRTTQAEIDRVLEVLPAIISNLQNSEQQAKAAW
jgi:cysteine desulfurase